MEQRRSRWSWLRVAAAVAVLALLAASARYGFLVRDRHVFPYHLLKRAGKKAHPVKRKQHARHTRLAAPDTDTSPDAIARLANLPYLQGYHPATGGAAVRVYDRARAQDGLNFFTSSHAPVATLVDMDGAVVKTWSADAAKAFPGYHPEARYHEHERFLRDAELLPDGGIVAMFDQIGLVRLDASNQMLWTWAGPAHHDLFVGEAGAIWVLTHEKRIVDEIRKDEPVLEDFVVQLSPEGKLLRHISLVECFQRSGYEPLLANVKPSSGSGDIFHANSVAVLDGSLAGRSPAFRRGNVLVSLKLLNAVVVIDPDARRVVWALSGHWYGQHSARFLPTGRLLLFDNLGTMQKASRVLEVDPFTQQILWSFGSGEGENLLSETVGFVERLRSGNTLITETNYGRVLEVTPDNRVVWEFVNPNRVGKKKELIAIVYFMARVPRDLPFLKLSASELPGSASTSR